MAELTNVLLIVSVTLNVVFLWAMRRAARNFFGLLRYVRELERHMEVPLLPPSLK